jgi:uncharacterized HAD superfamily protein
MDIIGLDIDGVLCNTNIILEKFLAEEFNLTPDWTKVKQYKLEHMDFITKEALAGFYELMDTGELYDGVMPHNYAEHATKKLRNEGFGIALITSRSSKLRGLTEDWLEEHDIAYDAIYFIESSRKHEIILDLDAKAFVEDRFDVLESVVHRYKPLDLGLYVIDYPYNRSDNEYIVRTPDVAEAVDRIVNFRRWRGYFINKCQGNIEKFIKEYQDGK